MRDKMKNTPFLMGCPIKSYNNWMSIIFIGSICLKFNVFKVIKVFNAKQTWKSGATSLFILEFVCLST